MNLIAQHSEAMNYSFLAKQARDEDKEDAAIDYYLKAANIEGSIADYYLDKPSLEPTRSMIIRSAAILFLKAGDIQSAKKYVFWGAANATDKLVQEQFNEALEICVAYGKLDPSEVSRNVDYIYRLRQKSESYIIEPTNPEYGNAVTLEMISDFSTNYNKSLKAYSGSQFKHLKGGKYNSEEELELAASHFQSHVKPILTNAGFGSFKFSIATDFLPRYGEDEVYSRLKSNILINYHENIFSKDLTDENIETFKSSFNDEERDEIFRPIFNIRSLKSNYKVAYVDRENFRKIFLSRTKNSQKAKLLPPKSIDKADIGILESIITHTRSTSKGGHLRHIILKEQLNRYSFDLRTILISSSIREPIVLNEEIIINVSFSSEIGFTFSYDELPVEGTSITYEGAETEFYNNLVLFIRLIVRQQEPNQDDELYFNIIKRLINNPDLV